MFEIRIKSFFAKIWIKSELKEAKLVVLTLSLLIQDFEKLQILSSFFDKTPFREWAKYRTSFIYVRKYVPLSH